MSLTITVRGIPAPQGSKRHVGRGVMIESSKKVKPWREAVRSSAEQALERHGYEPLVPIMAPLDGPLVLEVTFFFARPKSHYRTGRNNWLLRDNAPVAPQGMPDLSKLVRSTEDALTDAGVWVDDARVVLLLAGKHYTNTDHSYPGAVIIVRRLDEEAHHE